MREEAERLVREAMERKTVTVKQGDTRIEAKCGKCGAPIASRRAGETRVQFTCRNAGTSRSRCRRRRAQVTERPQSGPAVALRVSPASIDSLTLSGAEPLGIATRHRLGGQPKSYTQAFKQTGEMNSC